MPTPRILISHSFPGQTEENYKNAVRLAGGEPIGGYLPKYDESCDALLLCGGEDVSPSYYGQKNVGCRGIDKQRDKAEFELIEAFVHAKKPILGICRGHQILNVGFGGTLIQDISEIQQSSHSARECCDNSHMINVCEKSFMYHLTEGSDFVNSSHHQAISDLGRGLIATAHSLDGIIESFEHTEMAVLGVQYHPERMLLAPEKFSVKSALEPFVWLINACK